jgi:UDP:flavonoid glycosyltransferase YjiC (YdhE family)
VIGRGLEQGRVELNETRARLELPALDRPHGGISERLALVATFPQLEYPRTPLPGTHVVGPLQWEPPADDVELPPGAGPLVLIAPSTAQDADHTLLRVALAGLGELDGIRVLATTNRRTLGDRAPAIPSNTRLVDWVSYARTMPRADVVVCHGGHGTVVRALSSGCVVVVAPAGGDQNENAARIDWAGAGVRIPRRFLSASAVRLAVQRALGEPALQARAQELAAWGASHDAGARASELVEALAPGGAALQK